jgi:hypothetical protein
VILQTAAMQPPDVADPNLLLISVFAFVAVFVLLSVLAGIMRLLTALFPGDPYDDAGGGVDAAIVAAVTAAARAAYPGMQVTGMEETR